MPDHAQPPVPGLLTLRGVRGSIPTPGTATVRYGGNTCCAEIALTPTRRVIIDCGSGLVSLGRELAALDAGGFELDVFLTHYHYDHLQGLPFFAPLFDSRSRFTFHGFDADGLGVKDAIGGVLRPPWLPLSLDDTPSTKRYVTLNGETRVGDLTVSPARLRHPQDVTAFRLERGGRALVFATDVERGDLASDGRLRALCRGAEVLIHDAQYTPEEYATRQGWGHSTWEHAVEAAREAGVPRLVLFHHDPQRTDDQLDALVDRARLDFPRVEGAREGMTFEL